MKLGGVSGTFRGHKGYVMYKQKAKTNRERIGSQHAPSVPFFVCMSEERLRLITTILDRLSKTPTARDAQSKHRYWWGEKFDLFYEMSIQRLRMYDKILKDESD